MSTLTTLYTDDHHRRDQAFADAEAAGVEQRWGDAVTAVARFASPMEAHLGSPGRCSAPRPGWWSRPTPGPCPPAVGR